ncbi:MAG: hypothetical protein RJA20_861 [Bacteroidota bacterium]|jgi:LmbE family N-acetylglucosaminyl deacetylase
MLRIAVLFFLVPFIAYAQKPAKPNSADLHTSIKKLNVLGSVLYVAAHPDDENTRMISYLRNEKLYDVTYLSLTRGDGGQNLIGTEIRELLGVLRTQELLMARSVDGGNQMFSRANDFGYSKSPDETLRFWNKDEVLADVVWAYRKTQPDVVINRFNHDKKYDTHGHHTASAMLSVEAFDLAGKADSYPDQLKFVSPWQARRQFFNTSWWFYGSQEAFQKADKSSLWPVDMGVWLPLKGKSNGEIAAESRSMHRCQGFGMLSTRGSAIEYLDFVKGEKPGNTDIFDGVNTTWSRVTGGEPIGVLLVEIDRKFRPEIPAASVPDLLRAMEMISALPDGIWRNKKLEEIKTVIQGCLGLYLEATASEPVVSPGENVKIRFECIARASGAEVVLSRVSLNPGMLDTMPSARLQANNGWILEKSVKIPDNAPITAPYWLLRPSTIGMYDVPEQLLRGVPETPRYASVEWMVSVNGMPMKFKTDVAWKTGEPSVGEVWRPFEVLPPVFLEFTEPSYILYQKEREVSVRVRAGRDGVKGTVNIAAPGKGWNIRPAGTSGNSFEFSKRGQEKTFTFIVSAGDGDVNLTARAEVDGNTLSNKLVTIRYDHIPQQSVLLPANVHASRLNLKVAAKNVGYYMGAGDDVPASLRQMGCNVTLLGDADLELANLKKFDAIVMGVRAYNTKDALAFHQQSLFDYVKEGGTLIVQYNTNFEFVMDAASLAPYPVKISRGRVTDESSEVRMIAPDHPALNTPNKITPEDFNGWIQERGLYFPSEWDANYSAPLSMNDPGEKPADGSLLVASYGKGHYVYTGLSFFRELPAGVPGAYRLFANLLSLGK